VGISASFEDFSSRHEINITFLRMGLKDKQETECLEQQLLLGQAYQDFMKSKRGIGNL